MPIPLPTLASPHLSGKLVFGVVFPYPFHSEGILTQTFHVSTFPPHPLDDPIWICNFNCDHLASGFHTPSLVQTSLLPNPLGTSHGGVQE